MWVQGLRIFMNPPPRYCSQLVSEFRNWMLSKCQIWIVSCQTRIYLCVCIKMLECCLVRNTLDSYTVRNIIRFCVSYTAECIRLVMLGKWQKKRGLSQWMNLYPLTPKALKGVTSANPLHWLRNNTPKWNASSPSWYSWPCDVIVLS